MVLTPMPNSPSRRFASCALRFVTLTLIALLTGACSSGSENGDARNAGTSAEPNSQPGTSDGPGGSGTGTGTSGDGGSSASDGSAPVTPTGTGPVAQHGALHVSGGKIVGSNGPVALRGMSFFWSQWSDAFWNASAVSLLANDWHASVVRAAMGVDSGGYIGNEARETARVRTVVDAAIAQGIYVVIDWHDHDANLHVESAKAFFREMATTYGQSPNVIFEVWNEPVEVPWTTVKSYAESVIPEIRAKGATNVVIVGSPHWSQDVDVAATDPLSDSNVAYSIHFYANTPAHQQPLRDKAALALDKGLALFATEWGTPSADGNGLVNEAESQAWLDFLRAHDVGWCNWSLFDKPEAASALVEGSSPTGPWPDASLTASGKFVKKALAN